MSGGGGHRIGPEPIDPLAPLRVVEGADCGAVTSFTGVVRESNHGKQVVVLEYEAYPEMAVKVFAAIAGEAARRWPGTRLCIHHRTGTLRPGETSVVIAAASPHRAHAFDACRHAIEQLKAEAPIWKRERYPDGSEWVGLGS